MVQDKNEHNKIPEGNNNLSPSELEKLRHDLKKEHDEAISSSKNAKANILHELEQDESHSQREAAKEMMRQADAPEIAPENNSPEKNQLDEMFREIKTDDLEYPFFKKTFPQLVSILEGSRLGKNLFVDVWALGVGGAESSLSTLKLGKDFVIDFAKVAYQPRMEYQRTKRILEDTESQKTKQISEDTLA